MIHYVCTGGCLTVQATKGLCPVKGCYRNRNPLTPCECEDGHHGDLFFRNHPEPETARAAAKSKIAKVVTAFLDSTSPSPAKAEPEKAGKTDSPKTGKK